MGRIITKTFEEIDREWPPERIRALVESGVPSFPDDITDEDYATGRVVRMPERGLAALEAVMSGKYDNYRPTPRAKKAEPRVARRAGKTGVLAGAV